MTTLQRLADAVQLSHDPGAPGTPATALAGVAEGQQATPPAMSTLATGAFGAVAADDALDPTGGLDVASLAGSITRTLNQGGDTGRLLVTLHPPELGQVQALLTLRGDVLHVALTPDRAEGHDAIADALPDLHQQLSGGGVEVNVTLGQPGGGTASGHTAAGQHGAAPVGSSRAQPSSGAVAPLDVPGRLVPATGTGRIHLVL